MRMKKSSGERATGSQSLDTLLHTMRCIAQYEDTLRELSHEWKRTGSLSPESDDELAEILDNIPSQDYVIDLDAVKEMIEAERVPVPSKGKKRIISKGAASTGKKPRRKSSK